MRILLAGGTGVIGRRLVPALVDQGHEIVATTRREGNLALLHALGAHGVLADVYDAPRLASVVESVAPEAILHELTDLSEFDTEANARLRREGTAHLVDAARTAGVERMILQSISWAYEDSGAAAPATEDEPLQADSAVRTMEDLAGALPHATVLRYGMLYGPGTWYAPGGRIAEAVRAGLVPATPAITSFVHVDDAVAATLRAIAWPDGAFNIVDDEPAPATRWLPVLAAGLGAPEPGTAPLPEGAQHGRGASNAKARRMGWEPRFPSWREGFPRRAQEERADGAGPREG